MSVASGADWVIVEPPTSGGNRLTGGYLYNARMAAAGGGRVATTVEGAPGVVVIDGLWLRDPARFAAVCAAGRAVGARVVALLHGLPSMFDGGQAGPSAAEPTALATLDAVVAPGPALLTQLRAAGLGAVPMHACPPGVDAAFAAVAPPLRRRGPPALLSVGTVSAVKGHDVLAEALGRLVASNGVLGDWRWDIVGDLATAPDFVAALGARVAQAPWGARVRFVGPVAPEAMPAVYAAADVVVLPSRSENAPLVVLEALTAGRPLVASDVGGVAAMTAGVLGVTRVPAGAAPALAAALAAWWVERPVVSPRLQPPSWASAAAVFVRAVGVS